MSSDRPTTVLVVGATGSIGTLVVAQALADGYRVRALVRDRDRAAASLPAGAELVEADLTRTTTLGGAVEGVDAVVFTHGSHGGPGQAERVDYGAVRNILQALGGRPARIALMTAIGVTDREGAYNRSTGVHDWKRRSERLVRASGRPYTVVRPGWFDYNTPRQLRLVMLQGDTRHAGDSSDGVISRRQIAQVLVTALSSPAAQGKTFELVAEDGPAPTDLEPLFSALRDDDPHVLDAVLDTPNMPLDDEPAQVREDLDTVCRP